MSHVAEISLEIKDLDCLRKAAAELGLEFMEGQTKYKWYGRSVGDYPLPAGFKANELGTCEHALRLTDAKLKELGKSRETAYEIGIAKRRDGKPGYTLLWDFYGGGFGLAEAISSNPGAGQTTGNCDKLKQSYAKSVAIKTARKQGFSIQEKLQANGAIKLVCVKGM